MVVGAKNGGLVVVQVRPEICRTRHWTPTSNSGILQSPEPEAKMHQRVEQTEARKITMPSRRPQSEGRKITRPPRWLQSKERKAAAHQRITEREQSRGPPDYRTARSGHSQEREAKTMFPAKWSWSEKRSGAAQIVFRKA